MADEQQYIELSPVDLVMRGMDPKAVVDMFRKPTGGEFAMSAIRDFNRQAGSVLLQGGGMIAHGLSAISDVGGMSPNPVARGLYNLGDSLGMETGEANRAAMADIPPPDPHMANLGEFGRFFGSTLPGAAGSMLAMAALPGPKVVRGAPAWGVGGAATAAASRGALLGGAQGFFEARGAGASDAAQFASFLSGATVGLTEAGLPGLPEGAATKLGRVLARANEATEGALGRKLWDVLKTGASEAAQEGFQQFAQNATAKVLYDDDRKLLEGLGDSVAAGFVLGLFGGAAEQMTAQPRRAEGVGSAPEGVGAPTESVERLRRDIETLPEPQREAVKSFGAKMGAPLEVVDPHESDKDVVDFVRRRGAQIVMVQSPDGAPLPKPAAYSADGRTVLLDVNAENPREELINHEVGHDVASTAPEAVDIVRSKLRSEIVAMAREQYVADRIRSEQQMAGRDLTSEEIDALGNEQIDEEEALSRLSEDFSPVIRLLREDPKAFSKVSDVGFWRGMIRAALDVMRSFTGRPKSNEIELANKLRSLSLRGVARVVEPAEAVEIAQALQTYLDTNLDKAPAGEMQYREREAQPNAADEGAVPESGAPPREERIPEPNVPQPRDIPATSEFEPSTARARGIMALSKPELEELLRGRLAKEDTALRERHPDRGSVWYDRVADLRRKARDPNNIEGDKAALELRRAGVEPGGADVEEIADALRAKERLSGVSPGRFGQIQREAQPRQALSATELADLREEVFQDARGYGSDVADETIRAVLADLETGRVDKSGIKESIREHVQVLQGLWDKTEDQDVLERYVDSLKLAQPRPEPQEEDRRGMRGSEWAAAMGRKLSSRDYLQDNLGPLRRTVKDAGLKADPFIASELERGKAKDRAKVELGKYFKPIIEKISNSHLDVDDVELALLARAAYDRNALIEVRTTQFDAQGNPIPGSGRRDGSGMSDVEATKILTAVQSSPKAAEFKEIFKLWDALNQRTRELWVEYGLESREMVDALERDQPKFAPFRSEPAQDGTARVGTRQIKGREFKAALGRSSLAENPLLYALDDMAHAVARGQRNVTIGTLYDWVKELNDPTVAFVDVPPMKDALVNGKIRKVPDFVEAENEIVFKKNGETRRIRFTQQYAGVARAVKGLDNSGMEAVTEAVGKLTRITAGLSTRWNPFFPFVNLPRDVLGASFNAQTAYFLSPTRMLWATKELYTNGLWAKRYRASGAPTAFMDLAPKMTERAKILREEIEQMRGQTGRKYTAKIAEAIDHLNEITEGVTRLNAFRYAIEEKGMSEDQAASFSKNLTTNFERKGQAAWLNAWFAFSNAGIQGTARTLQALKTPGGRNLAAALVAGSAVLAAMNRAAGGDDEDGVPYYDKIPDYIKRSNAVFMLPGTGGLYITVPLPFVSGWFHNLGEQIMTGSQRGEPGKAAVEIVASLVDNVNPVGGGANAIDVITPTLLDPVVQAATGKNFAGSDIYPRNYDNRPDSELAWDDTNKVLVEITRRLNSLTGGNRAKSGLVDISPLTIEHMLRGYLGGVGGEAMRIEKIAEKIASGENTQFSDYPVWRRYVREVTLRDQQRFFKDNVHPIEEAVRLEKLGEPYDRRLWRLRLRAKGWMDKVGDLNDAIRETDDPSKKEELRARLEKAVIDAVKTIRETQK